MIRIPASEFFKLGLMTKELLDVPTSISNVKLYRLLVDFMNAISDYEIIKENSDFYNMFLKLDEQTQKKPLQSVNNQFYFSAKKEINEIYLNLLKNLDEKIIAFPESKKINTQFLLFEPWKLFDNPYTLHNIPESIKEDFLLFCQCYTYSLYTSSIIHILKATENYNIYFYNKITKTNSKSTMKWGTLISKTQEKLKETDSSNLGFKILINSLTKLKKNIELR